MRQQANAHWVLMLAVGAVAGALPTMAVAQYQTQNSTGRLLDANNRLGSDGVNDERRISGGVSADDIVYGNVTRGRQFRGNLNSTDATAFRGRISRPSDNLTRDAGLNVYQRGSDYDPSEVQRYLGDQRGVNAPHDFARMQPGSPGTFEVPAATYRIPGDMRMDATIPNPDLGLSRPTQYMLPGIRETSPNAIGFVPSPVEVPGFEREGQDGMLIPTRDLLRRLNLDEQRLREMREEYQDVEEGAEGEQQRNPQDVTLSPENPINDPLNSRLANVPESEAFSGSLNTEQTLRQRLVTAAPLAARQNTQYAELQKRLDRFRKRQTMTDEEANRQFMEEWNAAQKEREAKEPARGQQQTTEQQPPTQQDAQPQVKEGEEGEDGEVDFTMDRRGRMAMRKGSEDAPQVEGILPPQADVPIRIASFADGVKATGLKNLLVDAEKAMKEGKYTQSLDYYDAAAAVAPDNSMVLMGRAIAELGAGYYARAQTHIEQVLQADAALLMARYDLKSFFGDDRLQYIVRDLKDLAQAETRQSRPLFLLAFIAYSTENEQRTADYLKLAEQRGGSKEFYQQLREYWRLNPQKPKVTQPKAPPAGQQPPQ